MSLFGWFKKNADAQPEPAPVRPVAPPPPLPAPKTTDAPPMVSDGVDSPFGSAVAAGLTRRIQNVAQDMRTPGDKQLVSLLLRAVKNDGVEVPAMPADLLEVQRLLASPDAEIAVLAKAVQRDPATAAKFVSVANSPLYRGMRGVSSVHEALVRIGLNHSGMILLAIISSSKLFKVQGYEAEAAWLHAHSLRTAVISQYLARLAGENEQDAFMAGLLHDLGHVFMLSMAHEVWRASRGQAKPNPDTVRQLSGTLHAGFSALIGQAWHYRDAVVLAMLHHHLADGGGVEQIAVVPAEHQTLTRVVAAANMLDSAPDDTLASSGPVLSSMLHALGLDADDALALSARETGRTFLLDLGVPDAPRPA
jgi:HD-like signal output (HDOD) protein